MFLCYYQANNDAATSNKNTLIGNTDDFRLTTLVNRAIGLPSKMAKFCHNSNRLLVGRQRRRSLLQLYFDSPVSNWLVGLSVGA